MLSSMTSPYPLPHSLFLCIVHLYIAFLIFVPIICIIADCAGSADKLFTLCDEYADNLRRKIQIWPLQNTILILCPVSHISHAHLIHSSHLTHTPTHFARPPNTAHPSHTHNLTFSHTHTLHTSSTPHTLLTPPPHPTHPNNLHTPHSTSCVTWLRTGWTAPPHSTSCNARFYRQS